VTQFVRTRRGTRLDGKAYRVLHRKVLQRDGWRCQFCDSLSGLEIHHLSTEATEDRTRKRIL
jgi:hypothetical protein